MATNGKTSFETLDLDERGDGVAVVTVDVPGEPVNTLNPRFMDDLDAVIERVAQSDQIRAMVITSGKTDSFVVGADIKLLREVASADEATEASRRGQQSMQRLADLDIPVVAAIHGSCLGGGLELAMACDARVATDHKRTRLGLPEVQLGLIPGAGGTQRLPRLIGVQAALDLILTGKQLDPRKAQKLDLVDEVVAPPVLMQAAISVAQALAEKPRTEPTPIDKVTAAFKHLLSSEELQELVLEDNPLGRKVLFDQARKKLLARTRGKYPAPERALEAVRIGLGEGMEAGLEAEARSFGELAVSPEAAQLINVYFAQQALKKDPGVDEEVEARTVDKVGMMGAGLMGAGITYVSAAFAKVTVRLKDKDPASVGRGMAHVRELVDGRVKRKRISRRDGDQTLARLSPTTDYTGLHDAQVVIEAVFEDPDLKHQVLREVEERAPADVIFASNTSTIPITRIAEASRHPETVIGMHYFSPVNKMPLLEVIVTEMTAPWVTATCVKLGKRQGKTVIVVRDGVGFYTSRILGPYMNEAFHILADGVPIERIDEALVEFGFPVGPVKLLDEVGIDVAHKAGEMMRAAFGDRLEPPPGIEGLIADERYGRKNNRGFYLYDGKKRGVDTSVYQVLGIEPGEPGDPADIARRCTLMMLNEAAYCFGEGILRSARDGDIGAIFGLGFPPFLGGPFRYIDTVGARQIVEHLEQYRAVHGDRFAPAPVLRQLAESNGRFHAEPTGRPAAPGQHGRPVTQVQPSL